MDKKIDYNHNPWTTLEKKAIYDNPWIRVDEHQVINPGGGQGIYGLVQFKNIAVAVLPIDEEGNTYLVGQYRYALKEYSWEIPEGGCPKNKEDVLDSAKRELLEETGLVADKWTLLQKVHLSNSVSDEVGYIFKAEGLTMHEAAPEETEELELHKLSLDEAYQLCKEHKITDALSILAIQRAMLDRLA